MRPDEKKRISITIDPDLLKKLDEARGRVPRSAYIEDLIREALKQEMEEQ